MNIDIGFKIKKLRERKNISQEDLAHKLDITQGYLSKIENDMARVDFLFMQKICEIFDVSPEYFMDGAIYNNIENNNGILLNNNKGIFNNYPEEIVKTLSGNQEQISQQQKQISTLMETQNKLMEMQNKLVESFLKKK
jgi:transcriptional regulator with XRE-family HTH domain